MPMIEIMYSEYAPGTNYPDLYPQISLFSMKIKSKLKTFSFNFPYEKHIETKNIIIDSTLINKTGHLNCINKNMYVILLIYTGISLGPEFFYFSFYRPSRPNVLKFEKK